MSWAASDVVRGTIRFKHYPYRAEQSYVLSVVNRPPRRLLASDSARKLSSVGDAAA
uniref:Uncharacterized protein n=1 Tax=Cyanothece sp. (strain PCC 7425 / ATCC 29141) TaxID=395961 RepID=B8HTX2_CYAP4